MVGHLQHLRWNFMLSCGDKYNANVERDGSIMNRMTRCKNRHTTEANRASEQSTGRWAFSTIITDHKLNMRRVKGGE